MKPPDKNIGQIYFTLHVATCWILNESFFWLITLNYDEYNPLLLLRKTAIIPQPTFINYSSYFNLLTEFDVT